MAFLRPVTLLPPSELACLRPGEGLTGPVIAAYLRLIERRSRSLGAQLPRVWAIDPKFLIDWHRGGFAATHRRRCGIDLWEQEMVLFPMHHPEEGPTGHWSLVVAEPVSRTVRSYDARGNPRLEEARCVRDFFVSLAESTRSSKSSGEWTLEGTPSDIPRQEDDTSGGIFTCVFAERLSRGRSPGDRAIDVKTSCKTISQALRRGCFDRERFSADETVTSNDYGRYTEVSPSGSTPILLEVSTPGGVETVQCQEDPLLDALTQEIDRIGRTSEDALFPPLRRGSTPATPTVETEHLGREMSPPQVRPEWAAEEMELEGRPDDLPWTQKPECSPFGEADRNLSPCLSLEVTDSGQVESAPIVAPSPSGPAVRTRRRPEVEGKPRARPKRSPRKESRRPPARRQDRRPNQLASRERRPSRRSNRSRLPRRRRPNRPAEVVMVDQSTQTPWAEVRPRSRDRTLLRRERSRPLQESHTSSWRAVRPLVQPTDLRISLDRRRARRTVVARDETGRSVHPTDFCRVPEAARRSLQELSRLTSRQRRNRRYRVWHADGSFSRVRPQQVPGLKENPRK